MNGTADEDGGDRADSIEQAVAERLSEDFDRHFELIKSGTERTRGILYFFCLILIVNIVFFFEDAFNTSSRRLQIVSAAVACVADKLDAAGHVPFKAAIHESHPLCGYYYDYVQAHYYIKMPPSTVIGGEALFEKYKAALRDDTDFLSTSIPLLNIKVDRNDGLILQNTMALIVIAVLYLSISAERKSLLTIGKIIGTNHYRIAAVLDTHVFVRATAGRTLLPLAILLPVGTQIYRLWEDLFKYGHIVRDLYGPVFGPVYLFLEPATLLATSAVATYCILEVADLNRQLLTMQQAADPPLLREGREMMSRRLDILTILFIAAIVALAAAPVLARVNP